MKRFSCHASKQADPAEKYALGSVNGASQLIHPHFDNKVRNGIANKGYTFNFRHPEIGFGDGEAAHSRVCSAGMAAGELSK